jgi:hypothetical protein
LATKEKLEFVLQFSPNTAQNFTHNWSSKRPNDVTFGELKETTISNNFHEEALLKL